MENKEALEGADLRKLDTFLKDKDGNKVLGNLYRTVTIEGHVKWVCIDHFRANYQEKATKMFRDMVESLDGFFDENTGEVDVVLHSKVLANQFYSALTQAKSIYELKVKLSWETSHGDLKSLRDTLHKTNVAILDLDCGDSIGPAGDILNRRRRSDSLWQMMANGRLQSVKLEHINGIFTNTGASLQSMAHLRTLHIHCTSFLLTTKTEISTATSLITNCPGLQDLTLECDRLADLLVPFKLFQGLVAKSSVKTLRVLHDEENQLYSVAPHDLESTTLYLDIGVTTYDFSMVEPLLVEYGSTLEKLIASGIAETATSTLQKSVGSRLQSIRLQNSKLYIGDIERLQLVVAQAPNLSSVLWETASEWQLAMIRSFAEHVGHRTFKIVIEELLGELSKKDSQDLKQLLTVHNVQLETLNLDKINIWLESLDELDALVEAVQTGRGIKELNCMRENLHLSDRSIEGLASIVSQPELHVLRIRLKEEYMSVSILESIQWKHIRELEVYAGLTNQRAAMKALLDSMEKMSETIELEWFHFDTSHNEPTEEWELLQRIVSLLSLESLDLWVRQTFEQALALIQSMDFSRMHSLYLRADKWDSKEVQIILDNLQRATQLESIRLYNAEITLEQREQMESKGIELSDMV
ncbi:hypothetical protein EDD21DRAFT_368292 [Dissophora ornata]|nr:hypothetical protein EDD21DRAFT_368292 [Dissophora ornata]